MFLKLQVSGLLILLFLFSGTNVIAQNTSKPDNFCGGGVPWIHKANQNPQNPGCGAGRYVVHFDAGGYGGEQVFFNWSGVHSFLTGRDGTIWFEPADWYTSQNVNSPGGFCNGGVPWVLSANQNPNNPGCPDGRYVIHYDAGGHGGENVQSSWSGAAVTRAGQARTIWFEPASWFTTTSSNSATINAPSGFCNGGVAWVLSVNQHPNSPGCPAGRFVLHFDAGGYTGQETYADWATAANARVGQARTLWFEPASWSSFPSDSFESQTSASSQPNRTCPAGVGPGGIVAGSYPPQDLTQDQRQWLWEVFGHGNEGTAPVGYGGEGCSGNSGSSSIPGAESSDSSSNSNTGNVLLPQPPSTPIDYGSSTPIGDFSLRVTAEAGLNIRTGPGTNYNIVGKAVYNRYFAISGGPSNGWYKIRFSAGEGWVSGQYVQVHTISNNNQVSQPQTPPLGRNCVDNRNGSVTCKAIAVVNPCTVCRDPYIGIFEIPSDGAENRISFVLFEGTRNAYSGTGHCGGVISVNDLKPQEGFQFVQGCVSGIETAIGENRHEKDRWTLRYRK